MLLVPKAGLEPARISTVDFESTASTDFATSALKRYAENVVDYTCRTPPCKRQLARTSLSAEIFSIAYSDVSPLSHSRHPALPCSTLPKQHQRRTKKCR